jgi:hypothetical protein
MKLTNKHVQIIAVMVVLLILVAGGAFVVRPMFTKGEEVRAQAEVTKDLVETTKGKVGVVKSQAAGYPDALIRAKALEVKLPPTLNLGSVIAQVTAAGAGAGIPAGDLSGITPTLPVAISPGGVGGASLPGTAVGAALAEMSLTINATNSNNKKLADFAYSLETSDMAFLVSNVSSTIGVAGNEGSFQAKSYLMQSNLEQLQSAAEAFLATNPQ